MSLETRERDIFTCDLVNVMEKKISAAFISCCTLQHKPERKFCKFIAEQGIPVLYTDLRLCIAY